MIDQPNIPSTSSQDVVGVAEDAVLSNEGDNYTISPSELIRKLSDGGMEETLERLNLSCGDQQAANSNIEDFSHMVNKIINGKTYDVDTPASAPKANEPAVAPRRTESVQAEPSGAVSAMLPCTPRLAAALKSSLQTAAATQPTVPKANEPAVPSTRNAPKGP